MNISLFDTCTMADSNTEWIKPGARVNVREKGLHGTVKFFGNTDFAPGKWVGVELDDALGKNNGVVKGKVSCTNQSY